MGRCWIPAARAGRSCCGDGMATFGASRQCHFGEPPSSRSVPWRTGSVKETTPCSSHWRCVGGAKQYLAGALGWGRAKLRSPVASAVGEHRPPAPRRLRCATLDSAARARVAHRASWEPRMDRSRLPGMVRPWLKQGMCRSHLVNRAPKLPQLRKRLARLTAPIMPASLRLDAQTKESLCPRCWYLLSTPVRALLANVLPPPSFTLTCHERPNVTDRTDRKYCNSLARGEAVPRRERVSESPPWLWPRQRRLVPTGGNVRVSRAAERHVAA
jgi:hypothetical protein